MFFHNFAIGIILSAAPSVVHAQDIIIVPCNGDTLVGTYCYVNNDQQAWHWQSACGEPVFMQFISGTIESSNFDQLRLYAGPDNFAPLLFANPATPVELDLTGINVIAVDGQLYMEMTSNATNCCATDGFVGTEWVWTLNTTNTSGLRELPATDFTMYPNPSDGPLHLQMGAGMNGEMEIRIIDVSGREVYRQLFPPSGNALLTVDAGPLPNGFYSVVLTSPSGVKARSLQVMR